MFRAAFEGHMLSSTFTETSLLTKTGATVINHMQQFVFNREMFNIVQGISSGLDVALKFRELFSEISYYVFLHSKN